MKVTISATFDPFVVNAKAVKDALFAAGLTEADISTGKTRERAPKTEKTAKAKS